MLLDAVHEAGWPVPDEVIAEVREAVLYEAPRTALIGALARQGCLVLDTALDEVVEDLARCSSTWAGDYRCERGAGHDGRHQTATREWSFDGEVEDANAMDRQAEREDIGS